MDHSRKTPDSVALGPAPQSEDGDRYLWHLLFFISIVTLFEGYDAVITSMALPYLGKEFQVGSNQLGFAVSLISVGRH